MRTEKRLPLLLQVGSGGVARIVLSKLQGGEDGGNPMELARIQFVAVWNIWLDEPRK